MTITAEITQIQELNDRFRKGDHTLGHQRITEMVQALSLDNQRELFRLIRNFDRFTEGNDSHGEHDFGAVEIEGEKYFWNISYYDLKLEYGSDEPSNPAVTRRVLTIMHSSEY